MFALSTLINLKIRTRLYLGFLSLIAVALLLAGVGSWGINRVGQQVVKLEAVGLHARKQMCRATGTTANRLRAIRPTHQHCADLRSVSRENSTLATNAL